VADPGFTDFEDRLTRWRATRTARVPRVLVVDDEDDFLELSEIFLAADGYGVIKAHSATEAMDEVRRSPPDMALLDLYIPGGDGFEILKALRREPSTRDIPVFATTAADLDDVQGVLRIGFDGHFPKPVNWPRLRDMLRKLLSP
jgi:two-component system cell cycle response regulator DivK